MSDKLPANQQSTSDEIDLGQLFQMIKRGFERLFEAFLRLFLYLKKNALVLIGLAFLGAAIGFGLNQIFTKAMKTEVIVKPNLESKNYLYNVVDEIQANLRAKDTSLLNLLGASKEQLKGFNLDINPLEEKEGNKNMEDQMKYLETLQTLQGTGIVKEVIQDEVLNNSSLSHRITFNYSDKINGQTYAKKLLKYINDNPYFRELVQVHRENAEQRIAQNNAILQQLNELIFNYSKNLAKKENNSQEGTIVLSDGEETDIRGLFELKNSLIRDIEQKKLELKQQVDPIRIINFGKPQRVQKAFFGRSIVLIPTVLIGMFFLWSFLRYLNKKALEMNKA